MTRLEPRATAIVIVDVQERLCAAMPEDALDRLVKNALILIESARVLGAHVIATEQYPKGLGPTLASVRDRLPSPPIEKTCFSAADSGAFARALAKTGARDVVLAGMESHVCVFQTARALAAQRLGTWVLRDAVTSRTEENRLAGLELAREAGARLTVTETVVFDWLKEAGTDSFRTISKLVR